MILDEKNGNNLWKSLVELELQQIKDYQTLEDKGHHTKVIPANGNKKISVHFVFDVKNDGRHKARLFADGHLTKFSLHSVYSAVVSNKGFRWVIFLEELINPELWATYEKVYILIISNDLYGLKTSGARWRDRLADWMRELY
jgi:hypothetical protein